MLWLDAGQHVIRIDRPSRVIPLEENQTVLFCPGSIAPKRRKFRGKQFVESGWYVTSGRMGLLMVSGHWVVQVPCAAVVEEGLR